MGTRNITFVRMDERIRIAQYCQWDGYPTCRGAQVLNFIKDLVNEKRLDEFKARLSKSKLVVNDSERRTYTGAKLTKTREELFDKLDKLRYTKQPPEGRYLTHIQCVEKLLNGGAISRREADYLAVASRDAGNEVLSYLLKHAPDGLTFYTDTYVKNMGLEGDWQIEGVYLIDLDAETASIAYHGRIAVFTFDEVGTMSADEIDAKMKNLEGVE